MSSQCENLSGCFSSSFSKEKLLSLPCSRIFLLAPEANLGPVLNPGTPKDGVASALNLQAMQILEIPDADFVYPLRTHFILELYVEQADTAPYVVLHQLHYIKRSYLEACDAPECKSPILL